MLCLGSVKRQRRCEADSRSGEPRPIRKYSRWENGNDDVVVIRRGPGLAIGRDVACSRHDSSSARDQQRARGDRGSRRRADWRGRNRPQGHRRGTSDDAHARITATPNTTAELKRHPPDYVPPAAPRRSGIYLTTPEKKALEKEAKLFGISFAELVRRILDGHIKKTEAK